MQIVATLGNYLAFLITVSQLENFKMIVKSFVAMALVGRIPMMFAEEFPEQVKDILNQLNELEKLKIGTDKNTFTSLT